MGISKVSLPSLAATIDVPFDLMRVKRAGLAALHKLVETARR
jgi:hypothetical protein